MGVEGVAHPVEELFKAVDQCRRFYVRLLLLLLHGKIQLEHELA